MPGSIKRRDILSAGAVLAGSAALVVAVAGIGNNAENAARETVAQNSRLGCTRGNIRLEAQILAEAGHALGNTAVSHDPSLSARTRAARTAEAGVDWEAVAIYASTLVLCKKAYPETGKGTNVLDVESLNRIQDKLEQRFGDIDPKVIERVKAAIRAKAAANAP